eukprot:2203579-Rhodomonas_salina.1
MSVGLPAPPSVTAVAARKNCECWKAYYPACHHVQVCGMHCRTAWQRGHESVVQTWAELAKDAGVSVDTRQGHLPRPVHTWTDQRGDSDIKFNLLGTNVTGAVGDVSITHVALGSGLRREQWGSYKPGALADRVETRGSRAHEEVLFVEPQRGARQGRSMQQRTR